MLVTSAYADVKTAAIAVTAVASADKSLCCGSGAGSMHLWCIRCHSLVRAQLVSQPG